MAESYLEKRKRILKEQKKRFEAKKITGGAGDASVPRKRPKKKSTSKLAALPLSGKSKRMQKSKSRLNPSVDYSKTPKSPTTKNITKSALGSRTTPMSLKDASKMKVSQGSKMSKTPAKKTEQFSSFGAAFRAARKRLGTGKTFTYKGKKYSTVTKSELKGMSLKDYLNKLKKKGK
jgi:hypothetical protein